MRPFHTVLLLGTGLLVAMLFTSPDAMAQRRGRANTTGLFLNGHLNATWISYDFNAFGDGLDESDGGAGLGLQIGYGISPLVTLYLGLNGSALEDDANETYALAHVDVGVQLNFNGRSQAVPYANLALGYRQASFDVSNQGDAIDFSGGAVTLGGGIKYFLSPMLALDLGVLASLGTFTDVTSGNVTISNEIEVDAVSVRPALGLSWYPQRRRR